jgi:hypothetical protein
VAVKPVEIRIVGDADSAVKAFKSVDDAGEQTGSKLEGAKAKFGGISDSAKLAFAGMGAGAVALGADMFRLGADLEQQAAKAKTVFGDELGTVQTWAKENATAMGLTSREATGLATNFADLLIPMGMSREEAAKMSTEVIGLSGALSAWSGGQKSAAEVAEILQGAMLGETDALKGLGISISAADVEARLLANGQGELTGKAREQAEALAIQQLIMEKSTDAQKAFKDGVQSTNEKMAEQSAKFREAKEALAVQLTPAVMEAVAALSDFVKAGTSATTTSGGLQGAAAKVGDAWADVNWEMSHSSGLLGEIIEKMNTLNKFNPTLQVGKAVGGLIGNAIPGRASGGPVTRGQPYVVGEHRPELFVPDSNGTILPSIGGGGGTTIVQVRVDAGQALATTREIEEAVMRAANAALARGAVFTDGRGRTIEPS